VLWPRHDVELTGFLRRLTHTHTKRWHAHYHTQGTGHPYQGRFKVRLKKSCVLLLTMKPIYLDYNATTPIDPAVRAAMLPYLGKQFGNPSSAHEYGRQAHAAVDKARAQLASLIGAEPDEIVFTSGGSEAGNLAIKGVAFASLSGWSRRLFSREAHIIASAIKHPATSRPCEFLNRFGCAVTGNKKGSGVVVFT